MAKPKRDAKLASKIKQVQPQHNGIKVLQVNLSDKMNSCKKCETVFGKKQMLVEYQQQLYCGWRCSDVAD